MTFWTETPLGIKGSVQKVLFKISEIKPFDLFTSNFEAFLGATHLEKFLLIFWDWMPCETKLQTFQDTWMMIRVAYATSYDQPACLRPWMLSWRSDTGCSGFMEPEQALCIMEVVMSEGSLDSIVFWIGKLSVLLAALNSGYSVTPSIAKVNSWIFPLVVFDTWGFAAILIMQVARR